MIRIHPFRSAASRVPQGRMNEAGLSLVEVEVNELRFIPKFIRFLPFSKIDMQGKLLA